MPVVIVGAGSAALHHARACQALGIDFRIAVRSPSQAEEFESRFIGRYGIAAGGSYLEIQNDTKGYHCDIGIVATPPNSHSDSLNYLLRLHPKLVFIEKPLAISDLVRSNGVISRTRLVCGSQFVLRPSFEKFFLASVDLIRLDGARIQSSFCEALTGPASAHSWNPDFKNGWITDESSGGGVLSEYSHALFWVGWLIKKNGLPLPQVQLDRHVKKMNMASKTSLVHVEMSLTSETGLFANVTQSCDISLSRKSLSVLTSMGTVELTSQSETGTDLLTWTASNGFKERVELNQSDRQADAIRLISHLNLIASHPSLDSPLSLDIATWVDLVIDEVRNVVFNP